MQRKRLEREERRTRIRECYPVFYLYVKQICLCITYLFFTAVSATFRVVRREFEAIREADMK
jgi:hypothetical protein